MAGIKETLDLLLEQLAGREAHLMSDDRPKAAVTVSPHLFLLQPWPSLNGSQVHFGSGSPSRICGSPFELVLLVPDVVGLGVREELRDAIGQVAVDAVHVAGRGHDGADVFVAVVDALLHLQQAGTAHPHHRMLHTTVIALPHVNTPECERLPLPPAGG